MNKVPAENTKSAPNTERTALGSPYAQYVSEGSTTAKKMFAEAVRLVPSTERGKNQSRIIGG